MKKKGLFISIEGCEGTGKSTAVNYIKKYLTQLSIEHVITREPGGTAVAEQIRDLLLHQEKEYVVAETEALLMFASRSQHVYHTIIPSVESGKWVISDRFVDASYAYQAGGRQLGYDKVDALKKWVLGDFMPDLTILLDMPVEVGMTRLKRRAVLDRIEQEEIAFFERVRAMYLELAEKDPKRVQVIHADTSIDCVQEQLQLIISHAYTVWSK